MATVFVLFKDEESWEQIRDQLEQLMIDRKAEVIED